MKKFMSAILAIIMMFSIAVPVFAAEGAVKDVDNTFDNFEPAPGKKAPDNWYDPYCYEADGRINKYCLNVGYNSAAAYYCPEYKRIFTVAKMGRRENPNNNRGFDVFVPYEVFCKDFPMKPFEGTEINITDVTQWYCPYCGKYRAAPYENDAQLKAESATYTHLGINNVVYGYQCDQCDVFVAVDNLANNLYKINPLCFPDKYSNVLAGCKDDVNVNEVKLYRFLDKEQRNSEYSFIFKETEADFGDGKDGQIEDLKTNSAGAYNKWDSPDNPNYKPEEEKPAKKTFKDKLIDFFNKIAAFFVKIGTWIKNLFK